jgi:potassium-transporting ATPase KdpC subunit
MRMNLSAAIKMTIVLTVLTGILYPLMMVGIGHVFFPVQADGSLIYRNGSPVGSSLIAQNFKAVRYFHPRPSAAGNNGYDPTSSSGSNLGPTTKSLIDSVKQRVKDVAEEDHGIRASQVPIDMVTASGSGLDPEISPAAAEIQIRRVAETRGISEETARALISSHTRPRWAGFLGEPGVNVLELNLALDALQSSKATAGK